MVCQGLSNLWQNVVTIVMIFCQRAKAYVKNSIKSNVRREEYKDNSLSSTYMSLLGFDFEVLSYCQKITLSQILLIQNPPY